MPQDTESGAIAPVATGGDAHLVVLHAHALYGRPSAHPFHVVDGGHTPVARIPLRDGFSERDLSAAFRSTNSVERPWAEDRANHPLLAGSRSTSVGDVAVLEVGGVPHSAYRVESLGWSRLDAVPDYVTERQRRDAFAARLGVAAGDAKTGLEALAPLRNEAGYVPLWVRKEELAGTGVGPTAAFVGSFKDAVAQPRYVRDEDGGRSTATGGRAPGWQGLEMLRDGFGTSEYRSVQFDAGGVADRAVGDPRAARTILAAVEVNGARSAEIEAGRKAGRERSKALGTPMRENRNRRRREGSSQGL